MPLSRKTSELPHPNQASSKLPHSFLGWLWRICLAAIALLVLGTGLAILNNNFSTSRRSRAEFVNSLDRSLAASTDWTMDQYTWENGRGVWASYEGRMFASNSALAHMLVDCAATSGNSRLQHLAVEFAAAHRANPVTWAKMVDPTIATHPLSDSESAELVEYQRWLLYGISPSEAPLSTADMENMFSPDKYRTGKATHQLLALYLYRRFNGDNPTLQRVMNHVEERIAAEAALDFRVTDLYLQRIAFLLAAGRPDLVEPRWAERALAAQQSDGGWYYNWHGWAPTPYRYSISDEHSIAHATAQGMWVACMLRYRYPEWIDKNYPSK